jgi:HAD superfamily hydrolase (TIGR01509 family)
VKTLRGLCLDLDGTLADSLPALRSAYARFTRACGGQPSDEEFAALDGLPFGEVAERLRRRLGAAGASAEFAARYRSCIEAEHRAAPPARGARELLAAAQARGVSVAVVTSAPERLAERWLRAHGLRADVAALVGCEATPRGKPAADPYLLALSRIGRGADESLAVEDSPAGAESALGARIATCVVAPASRRLRFPAACEFVSELGELLPRLRDGL